MMSEREDGSEAIGARGSASRAAAPSTGVTLYRPIIVGALYLLTLFTGFSVLVGLILAFIASFSLAGLIDVPFVFDPTINILSFLFASGMTVFFWIIGQVGTAETLLDDATRIASLSLSSARACNRNASASIAPSMALNGTRSDRRPRPRSTAKPRFSAS